MLTETSGIEPPTSWLQIERSNRNSFHHKRLSEKQFRLRSNGEAVSRVSSILRRNLKNYRRVSARAELYAFIPLLSVANCTVLGLGSAGIGGNLRAEGSVPIIAGIVSGSAPRAKLDGKSFRRRRDAADDELPSA